MPSESMITYRPKDTAITLDELREFVEATQNIPGDVHVRVSTLFRLSSDGLSRISRIAVEGELR